MRPRHNSAPWLTALLALGLAGCLGGGPTRLSHRPTPPDPPPIPARKPAPAVAQLGVAPVAQISVAQIPVAQIPVAQIQVAPVPASRPRSLARAPVTAAPLRPTVAAVPSSPASSPASPAIGTQGAPPSAGYSGVGTYRVESGDTVYGVARRLSVPLRSVLDANGLKPPYVLRVGQVLRIPKPRKHAVQKGDTVYGVARRYGVDLTELVRLNHVASPYTISPGQDLILPVPARASGAAVRLAAALPSTQTALTGASAGPAPVALASSAAPGSVPGSTKTVAPANQTAALTVGPAPPPAAAAAHSRARPSAVPKPPPRAGGKFLWPVRGNLITGYGPKKGGLHNDGINIAAPRGAAVRAAENGVVAYVGNELRGFGNLILIRHAGGWVTAYAHNDGFLVARGQTVTRGQVIARVGSSGNVLRPQLHFEIRKGTRAVEPTRLLGPQRAAAAD